MSRCETTSASLFAIHVTARMARVHFIEEEGTANIVYCFIRGTTYGLNFDILSFIFNKNLFRCKIVFGRGILGD